MSNIFIGFLLIFLDFNLNIGNSQIGLIPDFVGYIVMIKGLAEMAEESQYFIKVKPFAKGMAVYTGILYFMDLVGITASLGYFSFILGILSTIISLYISYAIVMGVKEMEEKYNILLNGDSLLSTWKLLAIFNVAAFLIFFIPPIALIFIIGIFVVAILFLVAFNKSKNLYYEMRV